MEDAAVTSIFRTRLSLCLLGAAAACWSAGASAETWWVVNQGQQWIHDVRVPAGGAYSLKICMSGKDVEAAYKGKGGVAGASVPLIIEWNKAGTNSVLFPTPDFKLPLHDTLVKLPGPGADGHYCDRGWSLKSSYFPSAGVFQMRGWLQQFPDIKMFLVEWTVAPTIGRVASHPSAIGTARLGLIGDTRPTFVKPANHQNYVGSNVTLAITSHVPTHYCSAGHYELAWQRALVPDQANGFPGAMQGWMGGPKPNLPCNAAGPATTVVPFSTLRSSNQAFHYKYEVRARLVGNGFHGAWSPWREFAVKEPVLRRKAPTGLKLQPAAAPSTATQSEQRSGTSTRKMTVPLRELQIRR